MPKILGLTVTSARTAQAMQTGRCACSSIFGLALWNSGVAERLGRVVDLRQQRAAPAVRRRAIVLQAVKEKGGSPWGVMDGDGP